MSGTYVVQAPTQPSLAVVGDVARFPVRRIFCVGRNYADHAREMGSDPEREPPFFFTKPADAIVEDNASIPYPMGTKNLHFEAELVVALGRAGVHVAEQNALELVYGYAIGNDLTRRDLQLEAREKGRPWDWGKAFDRSAPCGPVHKVAEVGHITDARIRLSVNGDVKQDDNISTLIWSVPEILSILTHSIEVQPGDLVYTGTPAGVGPLVAGDVCVVEIGPLGTLTTTIAAAA